MVKITANATAYVKQLPGSSGRRLQAADGSSNTGPLRGNSSSSAGAPACANSPDDTSAGLCSELVPGCMAMAGRSGQQCSSPQLQEKLAAAKVLQQHSTAESRKGMPKLSLAEKQRQFAQHAQQQRGRQLLGSQPTAAGYRWTIADWFQMNADAGTYHASNGSTAAGSNSGVYVLSAGLAASNNSSNVSESGALVMAGTTRQPKDFTLHELRMTVLTLAVAVVAVTVLQGLVVGAWKLLKFNMNNLPM